MGLEHAQPRLDGALEAPGMDLRQHPGRQRVGCAEQFTSLFHKRSDGVVKHKPTDGARIRRRAAAMVCLGGDRKGHTRADDEEGGAAHLIASARPAAGLAGRATAAAAVAYAALLHLALLRARVQRTC